MKFLRIASSVIVLICLVMVEGIPLDTSTLRSSKPNEIKSHFEQMVGSNEMILDTRTPPRVKQHAKKKDKVPLPIENSHAGIAIPVDEESINLEENKKKNNYYKFERSTTDSGISTWILLSGQSTTPKIINTNDTDNIKLIDIGGAKIVKPLFKKKIDYKTSVTESTLDSQTTSASTKTTPTVNMVKIKTNLKKNNPKTSVKATNNLVTKLKPTKTTTEKTTSESIKKDVAKNPEEIIPVSNTTVTLDSKDLPLEAKDSETNITDSPNAKKKKGNKKKKNKNRRKKPADEIENSNSTKILKSSKSKNKEKPIGTQLYNYLSREMMPTLGVGLVGLMVTAGLASYFLYPFGVARRSYEVIDRKDRIGPYNYYNDLYSGGIPEEEAIGKVISGMPSNSLQNNLYKTPTSRHTTSNQNNLSNLKKPSYYQNHKYDSKYDNQMIQGTVENVPLSSNKELYSHNTYIEGMDNFKVQSKKDTTSNNVITNRNNMNINKSDNEYYSSESNLIFGQNNVDQMTSEKYGKESYFPQSYQNENKVQLENFFSNQFQGDKYVDPLKYSKGETDKNGVDDKKFVVGNVPQGVIEEVTPVTVPEHGPRMLRIRKKREINDLENEIFSNLSEETPYTHSPKTTSINTEKEIYTISNNEVDSSQQTDKNENPSTTPSFTSSSTPSEIEDKVQSVVNLIKDIFHLKINLGLELVKNASKTISNYIEKVQKKLDNHYRHANKNY